NAEPLPYGKKRKLAAGDIVVLAGVAPLEISPIRYSRFQFWTPSPPRVSAPSAWGLLIDGPARRARPLTANRYFLSINAENHIVLSDEATAASLVTLRWYADREGGTVTLEDGIDAVDLVAIVKDTERDLRQFRNFVVGP